MNWTIKAAVSIGVLATACWPADCLGRQYLASVTELELLDRGRTAVAFSYDRESLLAALEINMSGASVRMHVTNPFELPEAERMPGSNLDEETRLTQELSGFEVDIGNERVFALKVVFYW